MSGELTVDVGDVFRPYPAQARILVARQRYLLFLGGIAAGKTQTGAMWTLTRALERSGSRVLVLGRTERNDAIGLLWARVRDLLSAMTERSGVNWIKKWDGQANRLTLLNDSVIAFRAYAQPDKLRGPEWDAAWIDELSAAGETVDPLYVLDVVDGRLRGTTARHRQLLVTMTAKGLDPVARRFQEAQRRKNKRYYVVKATSYSNPYTPRRDLDDWCSSMSARRVKQEIYCILLKPETAVWPEFDPRVGKHCIEVKRAEFARWPHVAGIDWGATRGNVCLEIRVHPVTRQWVVVDELVLRAADFRDGQVNRQRFRAAIKAWWGDKQRGYPAHVVSDRAITGENAWLRALCAKHSPSTSVRTLVSKDEQRRHNGVEMLRDALDPSEGRPRLLFASSLERSAIGETPGILPSMQNLHWAVDRVGRPQTWIPDSQVWRDATDALRYAYVGCRMVRSLHQVLPRFIGVGDLESEGD